MGTKMYFIQEGIVDIVTSDKEVATSLSDGSYFGGSYFTRLLTVTSSFRVSDGAYLEVVILLDY